MYKMLKFVILFLSISFLFGGDLSPNVVLANKVALVNVSTQYNPDQVVYIKSTLKKAAYDVTTKYLHQNISSLGYSEVDSVRAKYLLEAMLDDNVDTIWFVNGGGGAFNLIPYLYQNLDALKKAKPKIVVGFSDVTAIHYFVNNILGWQSIHGVLAGINSSVYKEEGNDKDGVNYKQPIPDIDAIREKGITYDNFTPLNTLAKKGIKGEIVGGNATLVFSFLGTKYEQDVSNKILFLEDTGLSFRHLDRLLHQLEYMNDNEPLAIVFGQFYPFNPTDSQRLIYKTVIERFAKKYDRPVYYFPYSGHGMINKPLMFGKESSIECNADDFYCTLCN